MVGSKADFFRKPTKYNRLKQVRYYGLWLSLSSTTDGVYDRKSGLVKLRPPRGGYTHVSITDRHDPRNVGNIYQDPFGFHIFASLEEAIKDARKRMVEGVTGSVEDLAETVAQALDFVATGQLPTPKRVSGDCGD
jgi:hypothetical protein